MVAVQDPYFSRPLSDGEAATSPWPLMTGWVVVYGANLIVPLMFASKLTEKAGRAGMTLAILLMLGIGCGLVSRFRHPGLAVVIGGCILAVVIPGYSIFPGSIGLWAANVIDGVESTAPTDALADDIKSELGGFTATIVTGGFSIVVALILGLVIRWIFRWAWSWLFSVKVAEPRQARREEGSPTD